MPWFFSYFFFVRPVCSRTSNSIPYYLLLTVYSPPPQHQDLEFAITLAVAIQVKPKIRMEETERAHVGRSLLQPPVEAQIQNTITPPGSLLSTLTNHLSCRHLIIQGPPKSGQSSLLMDLACDLAAKAPCRCVGDRPCSCLAVILFLPLVQEEFPLVCQQRPGDKMQSFHRKTLKRIQIRRIANPRDLQQQLWKIQGVGWHEQPYALLLDGLDHITSYTQEESVPTYHSPTPIQARVRQSLLSKFLCIPSDPVALLFNSVSELQTCSGNTH